MRVVPFALVFLLLFVTAPAAAQTPLPMGTPASGSATSNTPAEYVVRAETAGVPLKEIGLVYGSLGDLDQAFDYLERGFETEPGTLAGIGADPSADPLRADPRWDDLMEKMARE